MRSIPSTGQTDSVSFGGHFPALFGFGNYNAPGIHSYETARSGFLAVIRAASPRRIFVPSYMCSVMFDALEHSACSYIRCPIGSDFHLSLPEAVSNGDLILISDYYGLSRGSVLAQLEKYPPQAVIVDCSQAYFASPLSCLATLYSPRKFLPVPDGGFVASELPLAREPSDEVSSIERFRYLLERVSSEPEVSRQRYLDAEASLAEPNLREMSHFSRVISETIDQAQIRARRRANYQFLQMLDGRNELRLSLGDQVPLCYPLMIPNATEIRKILMQKRIFLPTFWPDVTPLSEFERKLAFQTLFLPVDHRYNEVDMIRLVNEIDRAAGRVL